LFVGLILIFVGIVFLLERLDVIPWGFGELWPVFIIIIGISILAERFRRRR
jgi:hypothetical protein